MQQDRGHLKRWRIAAPHPAADDVGKALRLDPLIAHLLCQRGAADADAARRFIEPSLRDLHDPRRLGGAERAADRLVLALRQRQLIVIYGDYDVDGITAAAILFHTLKAADPHADVRRYVPHRIDEGYGLSPEAIARLIDGGARLIVSVDCGITARESAEIARQRGADLIITDHHEPPDRLPDAHTLVHPRIRSDGGPYPFGELCGAGVAYKLAWQFARAWCGAETVSRSFRHLLVDLLSLAALGTIADVVPLVGENRTIAAFGLRRIKHTPLVGLNALIDAARLRDRRIDSYHVGFVLGPRLNACGRMGHAREAVKLLTDAPPDEARRLADRLTRANDQRRAVERAIFRQARAMALEAGCDREDTRAIVLGHEDWHPGVIGIVCSRLVDAFARPAVLLSIDNGRAHGSARSIDGFNLHEALTACADHLESFGGHAMAAGMKLRADRLDAFRDALLAYSADRLTPEDLIPLLDIDAEARLPQLTAALTQQLHMLAPFGRANPAPVLLLRDLRIAQPPRPLGREARHLALLAEQDGAVLRCVGWNLGRLLDRLPAGRRIDLAAEPTLDHHRGRSRVELTIRDLRWRDA